MPAASDDTGGFVEVKPNDAGGFAEVSAPVSPAPTPTATVGHTYDEVLHDPAHPLFDPAGDIAKRASESFTSLTEHLKGVASPEVRPDHPIMDRITAPARSLYNLAQTPLDAAGILTAPITGALTSGPGSLMALLPTATGPIGKEEADRGILGALGGGKPARGAGAMRQVGGPTVTTPNPPPNLKPEVAQARAAGYVLTPSYIGPEAGKTAELVAGAGGKIKTEQLASTKNQETTNRLAAEDLGLPADTRFDQQTFENYRFQQGQVYAEVPRKVPIMVQHPDFGREMDAAAARTGPLRRFFPGLAENPEIDSLANELKGMPVAPTEAWMGAVQKLRFDSKANLRSADPQKFELGVFQRKAADVIENLVDHNLTNPAVGTPDPTLAARWRTARTNIAKSYDVETATNIATGDVSARRLFGLRNQGRPMTGNLKTIADFGQAFERVAQMPSKFGGVEQHSVLDLLAGVASVAHGRPEILGAVLMRPQARQAVLSQRAQRQMTGARPLVSPLNATVPLSGLEDRVADDSPQ